MISAGGFLIFFLGLELSTLPVAALAGKHLFGAIGDQRVNLLKKNRSTSEGFSGKTIKAQWF